VSRAAEDTLACFIDLDQVPDFQQRHSVNIVQMPMNTKVR
jgi:hypothetical protein